jgi:hypothetical protein
MSPSQYTRPGSNNVPIAVNDVVLITTPEGTTHPSGCGCGSCSGGGGAVTGAQGTQGVRGAQGIQGVQGTQGIVGSQGIQGVQGRAVQGTQGTQGAGTPGTQGLQGTQGLDGAYAAQGIQGVQGTAGSQGIGGATLDNTDDLTEGTTNKYFTVARVSYEHTQGVASNTWHITHNLNFYPNVTVQDSAGNIVEGEIAYTNSDSLVITFSAAFSGTAYLS